MGSVPNREQKAVGNVRPGPEFPGGYCCGARHENVVESPAG